ncbi:MAG TPA: hypothetical protein VJ256_01075, partial [Dehalococcoidia bacterium]|nr:hypothetical protein [Dehalococcoidia bacterium]
DMLRSWNFPQEKVKLVVNSVSHGTSVGSSDVKRLLGREVFWSLPYDRSLDMASQLGTPLVVAKPSAKAAVSLTKMAGVLSGVQPKPASRPVVAPSSTGVLGRILNRVSAKSEVRVE